MAWTVNSLCEDLRGVIEADPDAVGGTVPDRLKVRVRRSGATVWTARPWRFRQTRGTLTLTAGETLAELPADWAMSDTPELWDGADDLPLLLTEGTYRFQRWVDLASSTTNTGDPVMGTIMRGTDRAYPYWYLRFDPQADETRTYTFWYLACDPWTRHARLTTAFTTSDSDLLFVAKTPGQAGNDISVALTAGAALAVSVSTYAITITFVAATTTAAQVKAAVEADSSAAALVHIDYALGQTGTGAVEALAATYLSGPIEDDAYPAWPREYDEGWELHALAACQHRFGKARDAETTRRDYANWLDDQIDLRDRTVRQQADRIEEGMGDFGAAASRGAGEWYHSWRNIFP